MARTIRCTLTFLALASLALMAAPTGAGAAVTAGYGHHVQTFTLKDKGEHITVQKGHRIKLDLRTDNDGGFSWTRVHASGPHMFTLVRKASRPYPHGKHEVGYPYHTIYVLKAVASGTRTIKLIERQPFNHNDVARRFNLVVTVP